jgi:hypothetical protein
MNYKKPLIRITLGDVSQDGLDLLKLSVKKLKKLYSECDVYVCYNTIKKEKLENIDCDLICCENTKDVEYAPYKEMWKMYPPRLRIDSHEIVIDNDLLIFSRIKEIDNFFNGNHAVLLRGKARSYGKYEHLVPMPYAFNSGFYGMPPYFDFSEKIKEACKNDLFRKWENWCDDQGVIAYALTSIEFKIIEPNVIINSFPDEDKILTETINGVHFIGLNRGLRKNWKALTSKYLISNW